MRASKRILMLHTDIRRFYGSTKMLLKILSSMMGTPVKRLSPPQKLPVFAVEGDAEAGGNGHDDDDNELNADGEGHPELPGELADAAKEAGTAAVEAAKMPDEPPPIDPNSAIDGAIAAHDDDSDNDGDEDEKDEGKGPSSNYQTALDLAKKGKENNPRLGIVYSDDDLLDYVKNIYRVLLTRGIRGTFVYVVDPHLRDYLRPFFSGKN
jgi:hypothetical protein